MKATPFFIMLILLASSAIAETINVSEYFPLEPGLQWSYLENRLNTVTISVLAGPEYVNGVPTKVLQQMGGEASGGKMYFTNDVYGIREHKEYMPNSYIEGLGNITVTLSPPVKYAAQMENIGDMTTSSGSAQMNLSGYGTFYLNYSSTTRVVGFESIAVPLGNFTTIKIQTSLTISGTIYGQYLTETSTTTYWLAKDIGIIKSRNVAGGYTNTDELTSTNISPPVSADFFASPVKSFTPFTVNFHDDSIGTILEWSWDFGDGNISSSQDPSHTYTQAGIYTVSLTITGVGTSDTETKTGFIHVADPGADVFEDGVLDLKDVIAALQILASRNPAVNSAGLKGDGKIGFDEAIYGLQWIAGTR